jgi:hypothetical protein
MINKQQCLFKPPDDGIISEEGFTAIKEHQEETRPPRIQRLFLPYSTSAHRYR